MTKYKHIPEWAMRMLNTEVDTGLDAYALCVALENAGKEPIEVQDIFDRYYAWAWQTFDAVNAELHFAMAYYFWENGLYLAKVEQIVQDKVLLHGLRALGASDSYLKEVHQNELEFVQRLKDLPENLPYKRDNAFIEYLKTFNLEPVFNPPPPPKASKTNNEIARTQIALPEAIPGVKRPYLFVHNGLTTALTPVTQPDGTVILQAIVHANDFVVAEHLIQTDLSFRIQRKRDFTEGDHPPDLTTIAFTHLDSGVQEIWIWCKNDLGAWNVAGTYVHIQNPYLVNDFFIELPESKLDVPPFLAYHGLAVSIPRHSPALIRAEAWLKRPLPEGFKALAKPMGDANAESIVSFEQVSGTQHIQLILKHDTGAEVSRLNVYALLQPQSIEGTTSVMAFNGLATGTTRGLKAILPAKWLLHPDCKRECYFVTDDGTPPTMTFTNKKIGVNTVRLEALSDDGQVSAELETYVLIEKYSEG